MNKHKKNTKKQKNNPYKKILIIFGVIIFLLVIAIAIVYIWPLRNSSLQRPKIENLTFDQAERKVEFIRQQQEKDGVKSECQSKLLSHGRKTPRSVIMYHGVGDCSYQFSDLAKYFYDRGYNVYAPTAPKHGTKNDKKYSQVTSKDLVQFASQSANIGSALGKDVGVIGLSGGGMLATWTAQYHKNISHLVVLSPFFEPSRKQAAAYKIKPFLLFYGNHIVPDTYSVSEDGGVGLSYYALTQFAIVGKNLPKPATQTELKSVGIVMAEDDDQINQPVAKEIMSEIASVNKLNLKTYEIPDSWHIGHVIVGLDNQELKPHKPELYKKYFDIYDR